MQYGDPPNGPYGDPQYGGQNPQYGGQNPQQGGQYPQQGGQYPQQGGQYPSYGDPYQQPAAAPSYGDPYGGAPQNPYGGAPQDPYGGTPQWGNQAPPPYGTPPPSGGGAGKALPIIAAVVVAVLVLSGVGVWLVMRNGDSNNSASDTSTSRSARETTSEETTTRTTTTRTTTTETTPSSAGDPAAESELISVLPAGFSSSNCTPVSPGPALARLECGQNTEPNGPANAVFTMYADQPSLERAFNSSDPVARSEQLMDCPDGQSSPSEWTYTSEPDVTAGFVACGTSANNTPQVTWSKYTDLTMGYITGPDLQALHDWWWEFG